ncbi:Sodium/potassium-transporting ATPase subunit beta-2 [Pseudolycoriella hygida]|uniref:Sodium/potassium-transporting ATPase subunit beta-2 n=1 Tax=Pseudolycoriella hygida TaxID=35572 RepID=A0A9Q0S4X8_9DIPT|nr:Sodium/potassium-transporting ATPase subunit beta-2 [Pseudolycoriella hygida]
MILGRRTLFCLCLVLICRSSIASWDFWPFNINKIKTPTVKIIPETYGNFIYVKSIDEAEYRPLINSIDTFLNNYERHNREENVVHCDFNNGPAADKVCAFSTQSLGLCSRNDFGFSRSSPCLYFTLSEVSDWAPTSLNGSDIQQHSDPFLNLPRDLKEVINHTENRNPMEKYIWFSCDGELPADKEFIGPISYFPQRGFPVYYFPVKNVPGYQLLQYGGVVISIECKAWAKNIELNRDSGVGYVKFELLID